MRFIMLSFYIDVGYNKTIMRSRVCCYILTILWVLYLECHYTVSSITRCRKIRTNPVIKKSSQRTFSASRNICSIRCWAFLWCVIKFPSCCNCVSSMLLNCPSDTPPPPTTFPPTLSLCKAKKGSFKPTLP